MNIPKLVFSKRSREFNNYSKDTIDRVVYGYLFEGKSHRNLDEEYINADATYTHGWQSMGILHYLGIHNDFKALFRGIAIEQAICELKNLNDSDFMPIIDSLKRLKFNLKDSFSDKRYWMISANTKIYRHADSFQKRGYIDWRQRANFLCGDIVYIYSTRPEMRVTFKTIVERNNMNFNQTTDDKEYWNIISEYEKAKTGKYCRLKLLQETKNPKLRLQYLLQNGLKAAPQGPLKVNESLLNYLEENLVNEDFIEAFDEAEFLSEGMKKTVTVNKYERSIVARNQCIKLKGCFCHICGFDFEKVYGEVGKDFIHIHHIVPLAEMGREYTVNYEEDLIPICPNCHAMLHRKLNGDNFSIEQLKRVVVYYNELKNT